MKYTLSIKKNRTFRYILRKGRYIRQNRVMVYCLKNNKKLNFLGICVNKKNGKSVDRNKLKRWVRQAYTYEEQKLKKGYNIIVLYKKTSNKQNTNFFMVYEDLKKAFEVLDIYEKRENN